MTPADPQAHRANAALLSLIDEPAESVVALEQAIALRPSDYSLWVRPGSFARQDGRQQRRAGGARSGNRCSLRITHILVGNAETFCSGQANTKQPSPI